MSASREDDPSIDGATRLYRRVHPNFLRRDEERDCVRLMSGAFQHVEMSVALGDVVEAKEQDPASLLESFPPDFCLVSFAAEVARGLEQCVCRDEKDDDLAHGLVVGPKPQRVQRQLASASSWVVAPADACVPPADY